MRRVDDEDRRGHPEFAFGLEMRRFLLGRRLERIEMRRLVREFSVRIEVRSLVFERRLEQQ